MERRSSWLGSLDPKRNINEHVKWMVSIGSGCVDELLNGLVSGPGNTCESNGRQEALKA